jgi:hypothetical protein
MPGDGLELIPREDLVGHVGVVHPGVLGGEEFPEEAGDDEKQQGRPGETAHAITLGEKWLGVAVAARDDREFHAAEQFDDCEWSD